MASTTITVYRTDSAGEEQEIEVEVSGTVHIRPGRYSGPPEDCYPDESEVDNVQATVDGQPFELTDGEYDDAVERLFERAEEDSRDDGPDPDDFVNDDICDQFYDPC